MALGLWACAAAGQPGTGTAAPTAAAPGAVSGASAPVRTLAEAVEAAWRRQPESRAHPHREAAAAAQQALASAWTPQAPTLEGSLRTDRLGSDVGARELEFGVSVPLWLPGERARTRAVADSEARSVASGLEAARWRTAGEVRDAWWAWQLAEQDLAAARERDQSAALLAADVARRVRAGDLARADQHQADAAVAAARAQVLQAAAESQAAMSALVGWTGTAVVADSAPAEVPPEPAAAATPHPALVELRARLDAAERQRERLAAQGRGNPSLSLAQIRDRGARDEPTARSLAIGLSVPLGRDDERRSRQATAAAEVEGLRATLELESSRRLAESQAAAARAHAAGDALALWRERERLARETRGFIDRAYRAGEADLPSRLRVEAEAADARRQVLRAEVERALAVSRWRQALGLLP